MEMHGCHTRNNRLTASSKEMACSPDLGW